MIVLGIPVLLATTILSAAGRDPATSHAATVVRLGTVAYLVYNSIMFAFATPFNELFLIYVAMLGLSIFTLVQLGRHIDLHAFERHLPSLTVARGIAAFIVTITIGNAIIWLAAVIPALGNADDPAFLIGTGLITNPIYVQDLSVWLPLAGVAAVNLWQRRAWGVVLAAAILAMWVLEAATIAVDQWFGSQSDPPSPVVSSSMVLPFLILAAITGVALVVLLNQITAARPADGPELNQG
jgi:preprotein translocase subunit SecG